MSDPLSSESPFDYIVIGGGTAGLVVAKQISEHPEIRVLVVEAGADHSANALVLTPGLVPSLYGKDEHDWNFSSVPQPTLENRIINQPRGKIFGGSLTLNFMMLLYSSKNIIDGWAALGNDGWDDDSLSPYLRKFAIVYPPSQAARDVVGLTYYHDEVASGDGPVQVSFSEGYGPNNKAWMDTFASLGLEVNMDLREGKVVGAFQNPVTINPKTKTRSFAALAYYTPEVAKRPNLVVLTETLVSRILFNITTGPEPIATSVEILTKEGTTRQLSRHLSASREVILAAGTLQSTHILKLSGIGSRSLLEKHGISVLQSQRGREHTGPPHRCPIS